MARYRRKRYGSGLDHPRHPRKPYESFPSRRDRAAAPLLLEPTVAGYIAGFIDGEGALCLGRRYEKARAHHRRGLRLVLGNTDRQPLDWIQGHLGGSLRLGLPGTGGHKPVWYYELCGIDSRRLLRAILPLLFVKRRHAEVVLAYHEAAETKDPEAMARLGAEIDALNARGERARGERPRQ